MYPWTLQEFSAFSCLAHEVTDFVVFSVLIIIARHRFQCSLGVDVGSKGHGGRGIIHILPREVSIRSSNDGVAGELLIVPSWWIAIVGMSTEAFSNGVDAVVRLLERFTSKADNRRKLRHESSVLVINSVRTMLAVAIKKAFNRTLYSFLQEASRILLIRPDTAILLRRYRRYRRGKCRDGQNLMNLRA